MSLKSFFLKTWIVIVMLSISMTVVADDTQREAKQAELDAACEAARNDRLVPLRQKMVETCLEKKEFDSREECETYYSDYGERAGGRPALFYDLPSCVEAFNYEQSERAGDSGA